MVAAEHHFCVVAVNMPMQQWTPHGMLPVQRRAYPVAGAWCVLGASAHSSARHVLYLCEAVCFASQAAS